MIWVFASKMTQAPSIAAAKPLKVSLSREFPERRVIAISPDGTKLGFDHWGAPKYPMEVAEISTGKTIFTGSFEARVTTGSFTADSKAILVSSGTSINGRHVKHITVVDLETGQRIEGRHFAANPYESDYVIALSKRIRLVQQMDYDSFDRCSLVLVEFPTYREIAKVP